MIEALPSEDNDEDKLVSQIDNLSLNKDELLEGNHSMSDIIPLLIRGFSGRKRLAATPTTSSRSSFTRNIRSEVLWLFKSAFRIFQTRRTYGKRG